MIRPFFSPGVVSSFSLTLLIKTLRAAQRDFSRISGYFSKLFLVCLRDRLNCGQMCDIMKKKVILLTAPDRGAIG